MAKKQKVIIAYKGFVYRNEDRKIVHIRASKVGENGIKPDTWYSLNADGDFVEFE